jgi:hypothetical protein
MSQAYRFDARGVAQFSTATRPSFNLPNTPQALWKLFLLSYYGGLTALLAMPYQQLITGQAAVNKSE